MNRHAFLVLAHNQPELLLYSISRFSAINHSFFVHVDKRADITAFKKILAPYKNVFFAEKRYACNWGSGRMIKATLGLLKLAEREAPFTYYHLISGVDVFCSTEKTFDDFFEGNESSYLAKLTNSVDYEWRINLFGLESVFNRRTKFGDFVCRNFIKFQRKVGKFFQLRRALPSKMHFYKGSQWFSLHRKVVVYINEFLSQNSWYSKRLLNTFCPDEDFFQILVYNSPFVNQVTNNNLRYIDWTATYPGENLPRVLNEKDFQKIIDSKCFFCRKTSLTESKKLLTLLVDYVKEL